MAVIRNRFKELLARKERHEDRRIPYREVARRTGIHEGTLSRWANQVGRFDGDTIAALCKYFNCEISELLVQSDDDPEARQEFPQPVVAA